MPTSAVTGTKQMASVTGGPQVHAGDEAQGADGTGFLRQRTVTRPDGVQVVEELHGKEWVAVREVG